MLVLGLKSFAVKWVLLMRSMSKKDVGNSRISVDNNI